MAGMYRITVRLLLLLTVAIPFSISRGKEGDIEPPAAFQPVQDILEQIPTGLEALALRDSYAVEVVFSDGKGTYFLASANRIVIDSNHGPERAALSFVHEMHHAHFWHAGLRPAIDALPEAEYADARIIEEAEGVVKSITAKQELAALGWDVSELTYPLESAYRQAFAAASRARDNRDWGISRSELDAAGRSAGLAAVTEGFRSGRVLTSHTHATYADYFSRCWQKAHLAGELLGPVENLQINGTPVNIYSRTIDALHAYYC